MTVVHHDQMMAELALLKTRITSLESRTFATAVARDAAIPSPVAGMSVYLTTPKVFTFYDGTAWRGEWVTTFDPQIDQGATTNIAKTRQFSQYRYDGPMIEWQGFWLMGGAGTLGQPVFLSVPVPQVVAVADVNGLAMIYDDSAGSRWLCHGEMSAGKIGFGAGGQGVVTNGFWGTTPNIALAVNDQIRFSLRYRWA